MTKTICLISLGCAKNLVDSERLLASARTNLNLEPIEEPELADLVLVNTCAFLQSAVEEALTTIMDLGGRKKSGAKMMVLGCLPARYLGGDEDELASGLAEVDLWLSPEQYPSFEKQAAGLLGLTLNLAQPAFALNSLPAGPRLLGTPFFRAYLKIAEGCDNHCTYCLIPRLRGPLKSYQMDQLVREAEELVQGGVKELTLVAQDLTAYGRDKNEAAALPQLLRRLADLPDLAWIRLLYAYPERLTEALVKELASTPKVVPYLDLPFQHASPDLLKRMGRKVVEPLKLVCNLKHWWPGLALRTTFIVGFPGETDRHFEQLLNCVEEAAFDHLGVFKFSPEPETPASRLPDPVPQAIKEKRRRKLMSLQRRLSLKKNQSRLGQTVPVLVEGSAEESDLVMTGRAPFQAPEVDGLIYFDGEQPRPGTLVEVKLTKAGPYDLVGELC